MRSQRPKAPTGSTRAGTASSQSVASACCLSLTAARMPKSAASSTCRPEPSWRTDSSSPKPRVVSTGSMPTPCTSGSLWTARRAPNRATPEWSRSGSVGPRFRRPRWSSRVSTQTSAPGSGSPATGRAKWTTRSSAARSRSMRASCWS